MNIKERALNAIKQNYAKFGLKPEELDKLATHIAGGLIDESTDEELNTAVEGAKFYAEMMQSVGNRKATEVQNKYKDYVPKQQTSPVTSTATPPAGGLTMEQVQEMIAKANEDSQKKVEEAVKAATAPFLEREKKARLGALLQSHDKLKTIPKAFREKYSLDKEENLETLATQIESDYASFKQELIASGQFIEAPKTSSPESEADDFVKTMEDYGTRHTPEPAAAK